MRQLRIELAGLVSYRETSLAFDIPPHPASSLLAPYRHLYLGQGSENPNPVGLIKQPLSGVQDPGAPAKYRCFRVERLPRRSKGCF
jgi:hypothetical protein